MLWHFLFCFMSSFKCWCEPWNWFYSLWMGHNLNFKDLSNLRLAILCWEVLRGQTLDHWVCDSFLELLLAQRSEGWIKPKGLKGWWRNSKWHLNRQRPPDGSVSYSHRPCGQPIGVFYPALGPTGPSSPYFLLKLPTLTFPRTLCVSSVFFPWTLSLPSVYLLLPLHLRPLLIQRDVLTF